MGFYSLLTHAPEIMRKPITAMLKAAKWIFKKLQSFDFHARLLIKLDVMANLGL